ncbi:DUF4190 domain-containing protein [Mycobacterium dioxanotrophicus]|uniref:DUF4190 domain-containing protein n=1 Tax=Mycobacterium dioxanotrophicus TaxID=482462 RepID=UPI000B351611|nr:DUF4190 domain-containing protein [Mycobacterium dioxanotrophicus]
MTYGGYGGGPTGPFGNDPFAGQGGGFPPAGPPGFPGAPGGPPGFPPQGPPPGYPPGPPGYGPPPGPQSGQTNALATLSIVFGVVFAPIGAVLGHLALSQIKKTGEKGRERALIGLTVSYLMIFVAIIALVVFLVLNKNDSSSSTTTTTTTTSKTSTSKTTTKRSTTRTTVPAPPPPPQPQQVHVTDLRAGDCIQIEEHGASPNNPDAKAVTMVRSACLAIPGIYRVDKVAPTNVCTDQFIADADQTIFACISPYRG